MITRFLFSIAVIIAALVPLQTRASETPKFSTLPHLSPDLPNGTLAWEFPFNLHAGQISTGAIEDRRKVKTYEEYAPKNAKKFPKDLYKYLYQEGVISPVILGPVPSWDSRVQRAPWLAYITDRTHGSAAMSMEIQHRLGDDGLTKPLYDKKRRPLNFILVRKMANWTGLSMSRFENRMINAHYIYLYNFIHTVDDTTRIVPIEFRDLPETPYLTVDNPFRSVIGEAQHRGWIQRIDSDFSQFKLAAQLVLGNVMTWNEILDNPKKAEWKAATYFKAHPTYITRESAAYCRLLLEQER